MSVQFISPNGQQVCINVPTSQVADRLADIMLANCTVIKVSA